MRKIDIVFDEDVFLSGPGQKVCGHVFLDLGSSSRVKCLKLIVLGRAKTEWSRKDQPDGPVHAYQGHETYLDKTMTLYDAGGVQETTRKHPAGPMSYPFSFDLPSICPSSFKSKFGFIEYSCTAKVEKQGRWFSTIEKRKKFCVIGPMNSNFYPCLETGIKVSGETTMQYCRNRGRIAVTLELNRAAFYPGDTMECCVQIENNSNRPTWNIQLSIIRVVEYSGNEWFFFKGATGSRSYEDHKKTFKLFTRSLTVRRKRTGSLTKSVSLPNLAPSPLCGCGIMSVRYFVRLVVSAWLDKVKLKHRINIGSSAKQTAPDGSIPGSAVVVTPPTTDAIKSVVTFDAEDESARYNVARENVRQEDIEYFSTYCIYVKRGRQGFGFTIRGGREFNHSAIIISEIVPMGSADLKKGLKERILSTHSKYPVCSGTSLPIN